MPGVRVSGAVVGGKCSVGSRSRRSARAFPDQSRAVNAEAAGDVAVAELFLQRLLPEESKEPRTQREAGGGAR